MRLKDFFSLERYKAVSISILQKLLQLLDKSETSDYREIHIIEQYMYRLLRCSECVDNKACIHCGCYMPEKAWVRSDYCSEGKWPPFMSKEDWNNYKVEKGIKFSLTQNS